MPCPRSNFKASFLVTYFRRYFPRSLCSLRSVLLSFLCHNFLGFWSIGMKLCKGLAGDLPEIYQPWHSHQSNLQFTKSNFTFTRPETLSELTWFWFYQIDIKLSRPATLFTRPDLNQEWPVTDLVHISRAFQEILWQCQALNQPWHFTYSYVNEHWF